METNGIALVSFNATNTYFVLPTSNEAPTPIEAATVPSRFNMVGFSLLLSFFFDEKRRFPKE
jgi:hypothetical protein